MDKTRSIGTRRRVWPALARAGATVRADVVLAGIDAALLAAAYTVTLVLRFGGTVGSRHWDDFLLFLPIAVGVGVVSNRAWGLYGQIWRHAGVREAQRLVLAGLTDLAVLLAVVLAGPRLAPLTVVVMGAGVATAFMGLLRFQSRLFSFRRRAHASSAKVVVIGAADAAAGLVSEMLKTPASGIEPVALLDDDRRQWGRSLMGVPIEGGIDQLPRVAQRTGAPQAVLALSTPSPDTVRRAVAAAERADVTLRIVTGLVSQMSGAPSVRDIRDLEIGDLIGRKAVEPDLTGADAVLRGRRVLVTGAGGSIGSEIVRQVAAHEPSILLAVDHDETHLHDLVTSSPVEVVPVLADIGNGQRMAEVFTRHRPEVVFHAAAHKHVPLLETHPCEAVATNVFGTDNVLVAAAGAGVARLVFVSTDKAVRATSVMGASKRVGEHLTAGRAPLGASWCAVRFGNVLGSRGSVVPTFARQIAAGGPVTITDERMTRYFMSIEEAVQLVLQATALAEGGEVFLLDMGEPVRIVDLAERMIRLSGRRVGTDVEIVVVGCRPGEEIDEVLHLPTEMVFTTTHPAISWLPNPRIDDAVLEASLVELRDTVDHLDTIAARDVLLATVDRLSTLTRPTQRLAGDGVA